MNWKRGLLRLWIVGAVIWTAFAGLALRPDLIVREYLAPTEVQLPFANGQLTLVFSTDTSEELIRRVSTKHLRDHPELTMPPRVVPDAPPLPEGFRLLTESEIRGEHVEALVKEFRKALSARRAATVDALVFAAAVAVVPNVLLIIVAIALAWALRGFRES